MGLSLTNEMSHYSKTLHCCVLVSLEIDEALLDARHVDVRLFKKQHQLTKEPRVL